MFDRLRGKPRVTRTWFIMTVVRALPGSEFPGPPDAGIIVECFVPERDISDALDAARRALLKQRFELQDVTRCLMFDLADWDAEADPEGSARQVVERVTKSGKVEFGPFLFSDGQANGTSDEIPAADVMEEILAAECGWTSGGISLETWETPAELAADFDLSTDPGPYREIGAAEARRVLETVLLLDRAHEGQAMPAKKAAELAGRFLAEFAGDQTRYYINGTLHEPNGKSHPSATSTLNGNLLVLGPTSAGCLSVGGDD
jgi:hypothetical protein